MGTPASFSSQIRFRINNPCLGRTASVRQRRLQRSTELRNSLCSVINLQTDAVAARSVFPADSGRFQEFNTMQILWSAVKDSDRSWLAVASPYWGG